MELNIKNLKEGEELNLSYRIDDLLNSLGYKIAKSVMLNLKGIKRLNSFSFEIKIDGEIFLRCDRCLEEFVHRLKISIKNSYQLKELGDIFDINNEAYNGISLSLPLKKLCKDSCKGLCPSCGKNLNFETCGCSEKRIDPRWETLSKLFKNG